MPETAKELGLKVSHTNTTKRNGVGMRFPESFNTKGDERFDVHKSTHAATDYLKRINNKFNNWFLTLAAYNWGWGNVRQVTNFYEIQDFFEIADNIPKATKKYIYTTMAYHQILEHPYYKRYLQTPITPQDTPPSDQV